jgi:farnesyl diphosphate synthase
MIRSSLFQLQAFFLVADDMMDKSTTRRGQPCWYQREDVGMSAINDAILVSMLQKKLFLFLR